MARNKNPEETVEKILDTSYHLFLEKGYDHTTIQDITKALGLSKGAIYHHFPSKEDILDKISSRYYDYVNWFQEIRSSTAMNGLEKLRSILVLQLTDPRKLEVDQITMCLTKNPKLLALTLESTMKDAVPMIHALIEEGIRDGSITSDYPQELAEVFLLLMNIWIGVYSESGEDFVRKTTFLGELTTRMGMPVLDDAIISAIQIYSKQIMKLP